MALIYIAVFVTVLGLSAVCALFWALRSGQMDDFPAAAVSIFDDDEPQGQVTDSFPVGVSQQDRRVSQQ
jgi:cbb3-type cytochrome oxidase maturation protein